MNVDMEEASAKTGRGSETNAENANLKHETRKTSVVRCLVITTLLCSAAIVANVALIMALNEEEVEFKREYDRLSNGLINHFLEAFGENILAADSMVAQIEVGDTSRPYLFSIPEFEIQAEGLRELSASTIVSYAPILRGQEQRDEFEAFADAAYDEKARSSFTSTFLPHDARYNFEREPLITYVETGDRTVQEGIYRVVDGVPVADTSSLYAPVWQVSFGRLGSIDVWDRSSPQCVTQLVTLGCRLLRSTMSPRPASCSTKCPKKHDPKQLDTFWRTLDSLFLTSTLSRP
jgi:hypothetical protein